MVDAVVIAVLSNKLAWAVAAEAAPDKVATVKAIRAIDVFMMDPLS